MNVSHQEESVVRGLSTETTLTTVQAVQSAGRCAEKKKSIAVHMKLFSTGLDLRIGCGFLPLPEPREFPVRSSALAQLGFPRWSVSSWLSHGLRTHSHLQNRACVSIGTTSEMCDSSSAPLSRYVSQSGSGAAGVCPQFLMLLSTKIAERTQNCVDKNVSSQFIVKCVVRATENGKKKSEIKQPQHCRTSEWNFDK